MTEVPRHADVVVVGAGSSGAVAAALGERLRTAFHPASSCAIGAVVDPELAVFGVDGLCVADASVLPANTTNNPNLTCLMVGDRVASFVAGDAPGARESSGSGDSVRVAVAPAARTPAARADLVV